MESGKADNNGKKTFLVIMGIFILAFMIYYAFMAISAPVRKKNALYEEFSYKPDPKTNIDERLFSDSTYLKMIKEKAFHQSRIAMAESDSIYLTINLPDSTLNLEINGVSVHTAHIAKMSVSRMIRKGNEYALSALFSRPLTITDNYSTIRKMPLVIKMAPKDTSEFKPDIMVDTTVYEPVNYIMHTDSGIRIYIYQEDKLNAGDRSNRFVFDLKSRVRDFLSSFSKICTFRVPEYYPYIKIRIPRSDAKIIYRGLPEHGQIAVYR